MSHAKDMSTHVALAAWLAGHEAEVEAARVRERACRCRTPSPMRYLRQSWCRLCGLEIPPDPKPKDRRYRRAG